MDFGMRWCDRLYCSDCGSDNVTVRLGWAQEDDSIGHPLEASCDEECCQCNNCGNGWGKELKTLPELWKDFMKCVKYADENYRNGILARAFLNHEMGESSNGVVRWFEERCPNHTIKDLIDYDAE